MFVGTHASLPVLVAAAVNAVSAKRSGRLPFRTRDLAAIAVAGVLPDIIWPHLSLHARLTSWSHTVWFLAGLGVLLLTFGRRLFRPDWKALAMALWLAVVLHLAVDTISGGTSPLYPFGHPIGFRVLSFHYWILVDLVTVPLAAIAFIWTHHRGQTEPRARAARRISSHSGDGFTKTDALHPRSSPD